MAAFLSILQRRWCKGFRMRIGDLWWGYLYFVPVQVSSFFYLFAVFLGFLRFFSDSTSRVPGGTWILNLPNRVKRLNHMCQSPQILHFHTNSWAQWIERKKKQVILSSFWCKEKQKFPSMYFWVIMVFYLQVSNRRNWFDFNFIWS